MLNLATLASTHGRVCIRHLRLRRHSQKDEGDDEVSLKSNSPLISAEAACLWTDCRNVMDTVELRPVTDETEQCVPLVTVLQFTE